MCSEGRKQSPVDIQTETLLHDPNLEPFHVTPHQVPVTLLPGVCWFCHVLRCSVMQVSGLFVNVGRDIRIRINNSDPQNVPSIRGGPLQYRYKFSDVIIRLSHNHSRSSEHTLDGRHFAAEVRHDCTCEDVTRFERQNICRYFCRKLLNQTEMSTSPLHRQHRPGCCEKISNTQKIDET